MINKSWGVSIEFTYGVKGDFPNVKFDIVLGAEFEISGEKMFHGLLDVLSRRFDLCVPKLTDQFTAT